MDYKKLAADLLSVCEENCADCGYAGDSEFECTIAQLAATAITDLLARAEEAEARAEKVERERDAAVQCLVEKCRHIESTERGDYCVIDDEPCDRCIGVWRGQKEE